MEGFLNGKDDNQACFHWLTEKQKMNFYGKQMSHLRLAGEAACTLVTLHTLLKQTAYSFPEHRIFIITTSAECVTPLQNENL